jgi:hypothetical protein
MTMSQRGSTRCNSTRRASRNLRLIRFLRTARPSARGSVKPILGPSASSLASRKEVKRGPEKREPLSYTRRKSLGRSKRRALGKEYSCAELARITSRRGLRVHRKPLASSVPWHGGGPTHAGRPLSPFASGSRAFWRACGYSVETYVLAFR